MMALLTIIVAMMMGNGRADTDGLGVPILVYHRFHPTKPGSTTVTDTSFEAQLGWLEQHGYKVVTLASVVMDLLAGRAPPAKSVVITVDDGRRSQYTDMFPILWKHRAHATLFVYTRAISSEPDALTWDEIREMLGSGLVDVQSHTCTHPNFDIERAKRGVDDFEAFIARELEDSKASLERTLGIRVDFLAWPYGIVNATLERAAARAGYIAAFAVGGRLAQPGTDPFAIPRLTVSDSDRDSRLEELLAGVRGTVAETDDLSSARCDIDSGGN